MTRDDNEIVMCCKRLIWETRDLRHDVRHNNKPSCLIEKIRALNDFQRIIALHGLRKDDPFYKLCVLGSKGKWMKFKNYLDNSELKVKLELVKQSMIKNGATSVNDVKSLIVVKDTDQKTYTREYVPFMSYMDVALTTDIARAITAAIESKRLNM